MGLDQRNETDSAALATDAFPRRLRQARLAAGLTLEDLAKRLRRPISKQALSKLETGKARPSPVTLIDLAAALGVSSAWLLSRQRIQIRWVGYRRHSALSKGKQESITAAATKRAEAELHLRSLFGIASLDAFPKEMEAETTQAAEDAAEHVRKAWGLGTGPICGLVETLEERGVVVLTLEETDRFDGLSGWANDETPVVVLNAIRPPDRIRFDAAHELGHLVLSSSSAESNQEVLAHRFAAALLVPRDAAIQELGHRRRDISLPELGLLKQRWGLSMQAWVRRAYDCGIIDEATYRGLNIKFRANGWHKQEPYPYPAVEEPLISRRLLWRALEEGIVSRPEARELLPGFEATPEARLAEAKLPLTELVRLSPAQRANVLKLRPPEVDLTELEMWELGTASDLSDDE